MLAFYNVVPTQMRDELTDHVTVPTNFHSLTRVLTYNLDKAVANEGAVCADLFSLGLVPFPLKREKKINPHLTLGIMSTSSHKRCPRQPYFMLQWKDMRSVGVRTSA